MGYWGLGIFQNDDAADFSYEIIPGGWSLIRKTMRQVRPGYGDAVALVCAELITHALGQGRYDSGGALKGFIKVHGERGATNDLIQQAQRMLLGMLEYEYGFRSNRQADEYRSLIKDVLNRLGPLQVLTPRRAKRSKRRGSLH